MNNTKELIEVQASSENENNNFWDINSFTVLFGDIIVRIGTIVLIIWFLNFVRPKLKSVQELVLQNKETNKKVDNLLTRICQLCKADRVVFGKLHNGNKYASGEHYPLFSAKNEVCEKGIGSVKNNIKNIDADLLENEIINFNDKNLLFNIKDEASEGCKDYMNKNNLEQTIDVAIRDKNKKDRYGNKILIGIVSIQFLSKTKRNNIHNIKDIVENLEELKKLKDLLEDEVFKSKKEQTTSILNVVSMLQSKT